MRSSMGGDGGAGGGDTADPSRAYRRDLSASLRAAANPPQLGRSLLKLTQTGSPTEQR